MAWSPILVLTAALASAPAVPSTGCGMVRTELLDITFGSVVEAVLGTASMRLDDSHRFDREWVGGVLQHPDGHYRVTAGAGCSGQDTVTFAVPVAAGFELVAFWHTHGEPGYARSWFSADDMQLVADTGKDFYLLTPAGELKVLQPDDVRFRAKPVSGTRIDVPFEVRSAAV